MQGRQESLIILRAACVAGVAVSTIIAAYGLFLDFVNPLLDASAPREFPAALSIAVKSLPVWAGLFAAYGHAAHYYLRQRGYIREIHYIIASMLSIYSLFVIGSFVNAQGDWAFLMLAGGLAVSLVLGFPIGMIFHRLVVVRQPRPYRERVAVRISRRLAH